MMVTKSKKREEKHEIPSAEENYEESDQAKDTKLMKCKFCGKKVLFRLCGFKEMRRYQCTNCKGYLVPFRLRHFGNKYIGYPKWVTFKDWIGSDKQ